MSRAKFEFETEKEEGGRLEMEMDESTSDEAERRRALFSTISGRYDVMNDALSLGAHRAWKCQAVYSALGGIQGLLKNATRGIDQSASGSRHVRLLDLCCGSGDLALVAATMLGPHGSVTGLDFSSAILNVARKKEAAEMQTTAGLTRLGFPARSAIDWVEGDALRLVPTSTREGGGGEENISNDGDHFAVFEPESFDAVTMGYGLRNIVDIPRAMREMYAVLVPGGRAAVLDFNNIQVGTGIDGLSALAMKSFQGLMLDNVVVPAARALEMGAEYEYLKPSIEAFPRGCEQEQIALESGFREAKHEELAGGLMGLLILTK